MCMAGRAQAAHATGGLLPAGWGGASWHVWRRVACVTVYRQRRPLLLYRDDVRCAIRPTLLFVFPREEKTRGRPVLYQ